MLKSIWDVFSAHIVLVSIVTIEFFLYMDNIVCSSSCRIVYSLESDSFLIACATEVEVDATISCFVPSIINQSSDRIRFHVQKIPKNSTNK